MIKQCTECNNPFNAIGSGSFLKKTCGKSCSRDRRLRLGKFKRQTEEYKTYRSAYTKTPQYKDYMRRYGKEHRGPPSEEIRARQRLYQRQRRKNAEYLDYVNAKRQTPEYKAYMADYGRNAQNNLSDTYIRGKLGLKKEICPPALIAAKREQLKLQRLINQIL